MNLTDTHCHIHSADYSLPINEAEQNAKTSGVTRLICVGTDAKDSQLAVQFVCNRPNHWASIGLHPHEAKEGETALHELAALLEDDHSHSSEAAAASTAPGQEQLTEADDPVSSRTPLTKKIIAIGECGLDYHYAHSPKPDQIKALHYQIQLAQKHNLPLIFHVRDAFDDFWPIFDQHKNLRGVLHSYTDNQQNLDKALQRGLYIGINGIMTFTKHDWQLQVAKNIPLDRILLETDTPFLTPAPHRGRINEPANTLLVANFLANLRGKPLQDIATATTQNARRLFSI